MAQVQALQAVIQAAFLLLFLPPLHLPTQSHEPLAIASCPGTRSLQCCNWVHMQSSKKRYVRQLCK